MKKAPAIETRAPLIFFRVLLVIASTLVVILVIGTIYGLAQRGGDSIVGPAGIEPTVHFVEVDNIQVFTGIGRLRVPLADTSVMILSIAFPFDTNDTAFTEEITGRVNEFRTIARDYFSAFPVDRLIAFDEETARRELLALLNAPLRLGRIETLFFNDLLIIPSGF